VRAPLSDRGPRWLRGAPLAAQKFACHPLLASAACLRCARCAAAVPRRDPVTNCCAWPASAACCDLCVRHCAHVAHRAQRMSSLWRGVARRDQLRARSSPVCAQLLAAEQLTHFAPATAVLYRFPEARARWTANRAWTSLGVGCRLRTPPGRLSTTWPASLHDNAHAVWFLRVFGRSMTRRAGARRKGLCCSARQSALTTPRRSLQQKDGAPRLSAARAVRRYRISLLLCSGSAMLSTPRSICERCRLLRAGLKSKRVQRLYTRRGDMYGACTLARA
jgi:hypothetical protein